MNSISLLSSIAMAVGLAAALPQIIRMHRTRSSGGQSVMGWGMGLITNLSMAYVNLFGFGAAALMASNLVSAVLCVAAMALIVRFGADADDLAATDVVQLRPVAPSVPVHHGALVEMPTQEFVALRDAVHAVSETRDRRTAGTVDHEPEFQAA